VADALEREHESIELADVAANASDNAKPIATAPIDPAATTIVRWLGTIRAGGSERYVLRFEDEGVVATLGEREAAVLGWAVLARDGDRLHVSREGRLYEVHR